MKRSGDAESQLESGLKRSRVISFVKGSVYYGLVPGSTIKRLRKKRENGEIVTRRDYIIAGAAETYRTLAWAKDFVIVYYFLG